MKSKIEAMIYLLDDSDPEIIAQIENQLIDMGTPIIPILEEHWHKKNLSSVHHEKIFDLLDKLQNSGLQSDFKEWKSQSNPDLLEGALLYSKAFYASENLDWVEQELEKIRMEAWLQIQDVMSAWERVRVLNDVFFTKFGFTGDRTKYHDPDNSFIHLVLKNRRGNPISLSILYLTIAQRLNLPIFGVNLPQHFVMAFMPIDFDESTGNFSRKFNYDNSKNSGEPLFYLDAFSDGLPFDKERMNIFLSEINISPREEFYYPCSNIEVVQRIARNLKNSYAKREDVKKLEKINAIIKALT